MITSNAYRRTFFIQFGDSRGTAFTIDIDKKQYLVTARHVCHAIREGDSIGIYHQGKWKDEPVKIVGLGAENRIETDVAVFALQKQLSPSFPLPATSAGLIWGQNAYFLGFPYGLHTSVDMTEGYPLPLIKGALISGTIGGKGNPVAFFLDGHNNRGFSGGPVVFRPANKPTAALRVMAVVSAYKTEDVKVTFQGNPTGLTSQTNTGIVVCPSIEQVTDMIAANPIGPNIVK